MATDFEQVMLDAQVDAISLSEFMYKPADYMVQRRLAPPIHTLEFYIDEATGRVFEAGGLPATPFKTKALMTASALADGKYAVVTDDGVNNGLYIKTAGTWIKSPYDPLAQAKADATAKADAALNAAKIYTDNKPIDASFEYVEGSNLLHKLTPRVVGQAVSYNGAVVSNANHSASVIDVTAGTKLFIANSTNTTNGASGSESKFYAANPFTSTQSNISDNRKPVQIAGINYIEVTVPVGATKLVVNTKHNSLDIAWAIYKDRPSSNFGHGSYNIKMLDGVDVSPKKSRLDGQKVAVFGDELSSSDYVGALTKSTGAVITSYAEAGATSATLADIVAAGSGLPRRDTTTSDVPRSALPLISFTAAIIMIGSNDAPILSNGDTSVLPRLDIYNSGLSGYLNKFPNTYLGNLALAIEYLKYKSPTIEITLVAPPYINKTSNDESVVNSLYPAIASLAKFYSVRFADATHDSGLSYKLMAVSSGGYSTDGKNLNAAGNELLSKFVALKITN